MVESLAPWFVPALVGVGILLIMGVTVVVLHRLVRSETTSFRCPWAGRQVTVTFLAYGQDGPAGVASCSAFADPRVMTCGKQCVAGEGVLDETPGTRGAA
jgi:hypothetical protein